MASLEIYNESGIKVFDSASDRRFILHASLTIQPNQWINDSNGCRYAFSNPESLSLYIPDTDFSYKNGYVYYFPRVVNIHPDYSIDPPPYVVVLDIFTV